MIKSITLAGAATLLGFSGATTAQAASVNDAQIAPIAYTAGQIDIAAGKQALAKSKNKSVRAFAQEMIRDHAAVNVQALALVKKLHVTPQANGTSAALSKGAATESRTLSRLPNRHQCGLRLLLLVPVGGRLLRGQCNEHADHDDRDFHREWAPTFNRLR